MGKQVFLFWPGDGRKAPNDLARPSIEKATRQLEQALRKLGREPRLIEGFISKPHESIEKLSLIDDPLIGVCVHWCAYAFNQDAGTLRGVHSYRQPAAYFPTPGGTFTGESLPGKVTWARSYIRDGVLWMDIGKGEVVKLPPAVRDEWWTNTTRVWPFMAADLGMSRDTLMAHYMSNHIAVAYGDIFGEMVALSQELGFRVRIISHAN